MPRIRVAMNPIFGALFACVAIFNFYVYGVTRDGMQLALGFMMLLFGMLYAFGTLLVVDDLVVQIKNPFGMTVRTRVFRSPHDLAIQGRTLWIQCTDGDRRKVSGLVASGRDWRALADAIAAAQAKSPPPHHARARQPRRAPPALRQRAPAAGRLRPQHRQRPHRRDVRGHEQRGQHGRREGRSHRRHHRRSTSRT
jgi:hypothetical protein